MIKYTQKKTLVLILFFLSLSSVSLSAENPRQLTGQWLGYGYMCPDEAGNFQWMPSQKIEIKYENDDLIAMKVTGDDCVTAGNITWKLNNKNSFEFGESYIVDMQGGLPGNPNSLWTAGKIIFLSRDEIALVLSREIVLSYIREGAELRQSI